MSEQPDPFNDFFEQQANGDAEALKNELYAAETKQQLHQLLMVHGVSTLVGPTKDDTAERRRLATSDLVVSGLSADEAELKVSYKYVQESSIVTRLLMLQAINDLDANASSIELDKKSLLVDIQRWGFAEAWMNAASSWLGGVVVNFEAGEDIVVEAEIELRNQTFNHEGESLRQKIVDVFDDHDSTFMLHKIYPLFFSAHRSERSLANAEEKLSDMFVDGEISARQREKLLDILKEDGIEQ